MNKFKQALIILLACSSICAFAQDSIAKLAVYAFGASDAGVKKSFAAKLLASLAQGEVYSGIENQETFFNEFANAPAELDQILQAARRHGADFACAVSLTEAFSAYSINARMVKTADSQIVKTVSIDRSLKSLDDLTAVAGELAHLLNPQAAPPPASIIAPAAAAAAAPHPKKKCAQTLNVNEVIFKVKDAFPAKLKDCSSKLAKEMALAAAPSFMKKKSAPVEPKSFMMECSIESIRKELPAIPSTDNLIGSIETFVTELINSASGGGGGLDPKKLVSSVGSMNADGLINDIKKIAFGDECIVSEPYDPPAAMGKELDEEEEIFDEDESIFSLGIRTGLNFSHLRAHYGSSEGSYNDILGFQLGLVFGIAISDWLHLQPGLMYIQKGAKDMTTHYIDIPLLLSFKLSSFSLNAGPYFGICMASDGSDFREPDLGLSFGLGLDISMFYIGAFYNYGLFEIDSKPNFESYNRTLGFSLGVNL